MLVEKSGSLNVVLSLKDVTKDKNADDDGIMGPIEFWHIACEKRPNFPRDFAAYMHFRATGW